MKYIAIIDDEMLSNFRIDDPLIMVVTDKLGFTRGIQLKPLKKEYWIYDNEVNNWRCSHCHEIPKIMGYVGTEEFMNEHFNYCPHCGAKMEGAQDVV